MRTERGGWRGAERLMIFFILLLLPGLVALPAHGEEEKGLGFGLSGIIGTGDALHEDPEFTLYGIFPRLSYPVAKPLGIEMEGNFARYIVSGQKDFNLLGGSLNFLFKPIRYHWGSLFLLGGGGFGYHDADGVEEIGDSSFSGILQGGAGILYHLAGGWALRGEYRLVHISDLMQKDQGINTHAFLLGISF